MKKTLWLLTCFGLCLAASCDKTPAPEPAFKNSFSCKINGVYWEPAGETNATGGINTPQLSVGKFYGFNAINIDALKRVINESGARVVFEGIQLTIDLEKNKEIILSSQRGNQFYDFLNNCSFHYYPDSISSNKAIVTVLDTVTKNVLGTFEFEATNSCGERIKVTEGKFNVQY